MECMQVLIDRRQRGWDKTTVFGMSATSALKMGLLGTVFLERFSKQDNASPRFFWRLFRRIGGYPDS